MDVTLSTRWQYYSVKVIFFVIYISYIYEELNQV